MLAFDLIGDIHGHVAELDALLTRLGYEKSSSGYRCPGRKAVFVGDFIDRGPQIPEVVAVVRRMVDNGDALAVMGNHEFNAICYHTQHPETGEYLRPHICKNIDQHKETLRQYAGCAKNLLEDVDWFRSLPLCLDLDGLRVIHACWHPDMLDNFAGEVQTAPLRKEEWLFEAAEKKSKKYQAVEILLKGLEVELPSGIRFTDKDGHDRGEVRTRWWDRTGGSFRDMAVAPEETLANIPTTPFPKDRHLGYGADEVPVFFGHYWMIGQPALLAANVCCLDYSVANPGGRLCCYRWDGESVLSPDKFVTVDRF